MRARSETFNLRTGLIAVAALVVGSLALPCLAASAKKPKEFALGIKAQDAREWDDSIELLTSALRKQKEDGAPVRIYGNRFVYYLPHYYLGLAYYRNEDCSKALEEWSKSLNAEFVKRTREYESLLKYQHDCQKQLRVPKS